MLKTLIKRDGTHEPHAPAKVNRWAKWGSRGRVDWSSIVLTATGRCQEIETTQAYQQHLIDVCNEHEDWPHRKMAGALYAPLRMKALYGNAVPTIQELHYRLIGEGLMVYLNYAPEEYALAQTFIDHQRDQDYAHFQLHQIRKKYSITKNGKEEFESAQFVFMRMAMALAECESDPDIKMRDVQAWYDHFSLNRINAPTPNYVNLGTPQRGFASCCVIYANDTESSIECADHIAARMTASSAGIGGYLAIRSTDDPIRGGRILHSGKLPYYRARGGNVRKSMQAGRGGANTEYFTGFDPEAFTIASLQNPRSPDARRNRDLFFAMSGNAFIAKKAAAKEAEDRKLFTFNAFTAPDLHKAFFSGDLKAFEDLYAKYEADEGFVKHYFDARQLVKHAMAEGYNVGTLFLFFADEANRHTPFKEPIHSGNLCVAPETVILTRDGYQQIKPLAGQKVDIWNGEEFTEVEVVKTGENQKLVSVVTTSGYSLECTEYHKWYIFDGYGQPYKEVRTHELRPGDKLCKFDTPVIEGTLELEQAYINGFYTGDGCSTIDGQRVYLYHGKRELAHLFEGGSKWYVQDNYKRQYKHYRNLKDKFFVPNASYTIKSRLDWLAGYSDADGSIYRNQDNQQLVIGGINKKFLIETSLMLQTLGVIPKVQRALGAGWRDLPLNDGSGEMGSFYCKDMYRLIINSVDLQHLRKLGFETHRLKIVDHEPQRDARHFIEIESITDHGRIDDTYCFNEPKRHMGMFNGLLTGQCIEINLPTKGYENVTDLYLEEDHGRGEVALCTIGGVVPTNIHSEEVYESAAYYALKMCDRCIHMSEYKMPHIGYTAKQRMNVAIGIVGLAYHMARKGLKYDSQEGRNEIHRTYERHMYWLIKGSLRLSKERGKAPWIHKTKWVDGWVPTHTYKRTIDDIVTCDYVYDWAELSDEIKENGGIGHSALSAHMPTESSSKAAGMPNGMYPIRDHALKKSDGGNIIDWCAPDNDILADQYQIAYEIHHKHMAMCYGIVQKWTDQGLSPDFYRDRTVQVDLSAKDLVDEYLNYVRYGLKGRYYPVSRVSAQQKRAMESGADLFKNEELVHEAETAQAGCVSGACTL